MSRKAVKKAPARKSHSRRLPLLIGLGMIVVAAVVAILTTGSGSAGTGVEQTRPVTVAGSLPAYQTVVADPAIGMRVPEITGSTFDGSTLSITNDGVPKAIIFLAHWCPHCQNEVENLTSWFGQNTLPAGIEIVAISTGVDVSQPNYPPSKWLAGFPIPTIVDDANSSSARSFGLAGFPFVVLVNADGTVAQRIEGEISPDSLVQMLQQMAGSSG
jgi:cytochrome c biogenesis protein CcmG/thiol:disulfide interchange protein DsbE